MAHRTQPPARDEIAEQAIDFIENLGYPLVPWQAEMLRNMLKHDGSVELSPPPRKSRNGLCICVMGYSKNCPIHGDQS